MSRMRKLITSTLGLIMAMAGVAAAQDYPSKPIRLIIPFPPGGSNDVVGRMIANGLGPRLGQQIVVDNRAGAGGVVGTELAAQAQPDGYTLLVVSLAHAVNPWLYPKIKYDPIKSFAPVAMMGSGPNILTVHPSLPVSSVKELIDYARKNPGKLNVAHAGVGSFQHLGSSLFLVQTKLDMVLVPFKGGGPAMIDTIAGHSQVTLGSLVQTTPHVKSGKLKPLGVGSLKRNALFPEVPTIAEAGVPGYEAVNWWGIFAPAGTPAPVLARLQKALGEVQDSQDTQKQFANEGAEVVKMVGAEFGRFVETELGKWQKVVKETGMKAE